MFRDAPHDRGFDYSLFEIDPLIRLLLGRSIILQLLSIVELQWKFWNEQKMTDNYFKIILTNGTEYL